MLIDKRLAAVLALLVATAPVHAASIKYTFTASADNREVSGTDRAEDRVATYVPFIGNIASYQTADNGASGAWVRGFADPLSGVIKLGSVATSTTSADVLAYGTSNAMGLIEISETFTATGAGEVTFFVDYDGFITETRSGPASFFNGAQVQTRLFARTGPSDSRDDTTTLRSGDFAQETNAIDDRAAITLDVAENDTVELFLTLRTDAGTNVRGPSSSQGTAANFLSTFNLGFETTGTLQLSASDPAFLSGPADDDDGPLSPVPVPAALPMLASALGLGALMGRRRRTG